MLNLLKSLTRTQKRNIFVAIDTGLIPAALLFAFSLDMSTQTAWDSFIAYLPVLPYLLVVSVALSLWLCISSSTLNEYDTGSIGRTGVFAGLLAMTSALLTTAANMPLPLSTQITFGISFFVFSIMSRAVLLQVVLAIYRKGTDRCRVLIYGAGTTGMQLVSALRSHEQIEPVAFVDDNQALQGVSVLRLPVYSPVRIAEIVAEGRIDRVLLAIPSQSHPKQMQIARRLQKMGLEVQTLPSFSQLIGEEALLDKLTPVNARNFLGRDEVIKPRHGGGEAYAGRRVLISGAGGSIGSELSRQVLEYHPEKIVLYELSELALYQIHQELAQLAEGSNIEIVPLLGSVTDARQVRRVLADHEIEVVLHAAAYKHVPLVEYNPLAGLANNALGTQTLVTEAAEAGVERFMLISSDKAVRPTNMMGASKRLAELVVQDIANRVAAPKGLKFSIVRFGNVLGSSGSVVPLFQEQLRRGGPLTVTHREVERYFMTVQEAVNLVLRAGSMAKGGEVFVLDMGKPVKIEQLARQVIESAGFTVRDAQNPDGDIEIEFTGLRPGEKMTEELTISGTQVGTGHKKIFFTNEESLSEIEVASAMRSLRHALAASDEAAARATVKRWVEGYNTPKETADGTREAISPVS
ncbi:nucleoside-diphosphate sugar epimerase/dehydratase [Tateyamaria sp. ANG-S1]|uniref:polysaccharide biosynthesis protein n=1 Tax=Tateyamaria sp. ANG-S1 TaxID=1577905 RepID=UPI00057F527F|nr:nucleoside-diphosphate sugar epimerase/dehydratase [Tateyamaria sp. ANG-S1]KIC50168.1 nucleotide sugar epimerase [Tateyamaria sp. ANG-S1]